HPLPARTRFRHSWYRPLPSLRPHAFRTEVDAVNSRTGGHVEHRAVITPGAVPGGDARFNTTEVGAIWCKDVDAARPGREEVAYLVHFHPIWYPFLGFRP